MADPLKPKFDAIYVAHSFLDLYAMDRKVFALKFFTSEGKEVIVELPGQGAKFLRDKMLEAFREHPEMEKWGADFKPS